MRSTVPRKIMVKILLCGCCGKMGKVVAECVSKRTDCEIIAGIDPFDDGSHPFPVYSAPSEFDGRADVIIDFSHPSALAGLLEYAVASSTPAVVSTTGLNDAQLSLIKQASRRIAVFFSANMSLGVNLVRELAVTAAKLLGNDFDIEIVEKHHNQKIDAPSGTALMIADAIADALPEKPVYEYDRHIKLEKRTRDEIGIHSVRGGTIVGEHEIIFAGLDEVIAISHSARSKQLFAVGALNAALFLAGKEAGLYDMPMLIGNGGNE